MIRYQTIKPLLPLYILRTILSLKLLCGNVLNIKSQECKKVYVLINIWFVLN